MKRFNIPVSPFPSVFHRNELARYNGDRGGFDEWEGIGKNVSSHIGVLLRVRRVQTGAIREGRDRAIRSRVDHHGKTTTTGCPAYANGRMFDTFRGIIVRSDSLIQQ